MKSSPFFMAYVECAIWASTDDDGEPLDSYSDELAPETIKAMRDDCASFLLVARRDLREACRHYPYSMTQAGHDLWLTRNRHGAGFWDRGLDEVGDRLSDIAKHEGSRDLYVGDDGRIYQF